jgi:DNA-binding MarR family transcriptional regulator
MDVFHDYAFVINGKKRKEVVKLLVDPRTPTELAKLLKVHANVITRILKDLSGRQLVEHHELKSRKKTYRLTKRGELARQVLDYLIEPKTLPELVKLLKTHRNVITSITKHFIQAGFITLFKNFKTARKFYQLTKQGEAVREKIEQ